MTSLKTARKWVMAAAAVAIAVKAKPAWMDGAKVAAGLAILAALGLRTLYLHQDSLLYHPKVFAQHCSPADNPPPFRNPKEFHELPYEDLEVRTSDGLKLHCWLIHHEEKSPTLPTIIFFHGNAANMGFRLPNLQLLHAELEVNLIAVSYRGYGDSEGHPSEHGLQLDAEAVLQHALKHPRINKDKLFLFGRSLGGAVALHLAAKASDDIQGTIVENSFTSIADMVDHLFPLLAPLKSFVLRIGWNNNEKVQAVKHPILFISGLKDELVPPSHMQRLFDLAIRCKFKEIARILNGSHNDTWQSGGAHYMEALRNFLERVLSTADSLDSSQISNGEISSRSLD